MIRHPALPSLLFLMGCGFVAAAGVIVIAGMIEALADIVLAADDADGERMGADGDRDAREGDAVAVALRAPLAKVQGPTSEYVDKVLRKGGWK